MVNVTNCLPIGTHIRIVKRFIFNKFPVRSWLLELLGKWIQSSSLLLWMIHAGRIVQKLGWIRAPHLLRGHGCMNVIYHEFPLLQRNGMIRLIYSNSEPLGVNVLSTILYPLLMHFMVPNSVCFYLSQRRL